MQVELHSHPGMMAQIMEMERVLRLLPSCVTGDSGDVRIAEIVITSELIWAEMVSCLLCFVISALVYFGAPRSSLEFGRTRYVSFRWTTPEMAPCHPGC